MADNWRFGTSRTRKGRGWLKILGGFLAILLLAVAIRAVIPPGTPAIKAPGSENGIASLETINIGGQDQSVLIRGHDDEAPVVLFLHGGPGSGQILVSRKFFAEMEQDFVVVNWDQRGTGKSWSGDIDPSTMTLEQFVADTLELTNLLRERFNQEKIYLVGHSWGTYVGALAVQQQPELYHAYVGVGQMVSFEESERLSYAFALDAAKSQDNAKAVAELEEIGAPPYSNPKADVNVQRTWLSRLGGVQKEVDMTVEMVKALLTGREYTLLDAWGFLQGQKFSGEHLFPYLTEVNMFEQVPALEVPVWFVSGKYDGITMFSLTQQYYQAVQAPAKEHVMFENSAHLPYFEEPEKFARLMLQVLTATEEGRN